MSVMNEIYKKLRDGLQKALTEFYRSKYQTIAVSPVYEDLETDVIEIYVRPPILVFDPKELFRSHRGNATGTQVTSYKQLFIRNDGHPYKNIYLVAKPGVGKTTFCTHLSAVWCQAHNPDESVADKFDNDDIQALRQYQLAFFISLRMQSHCDVDEMVKSFIKTRLTVNITPEFIRKMLVEEHCLVVLDGLDEWNHSKKCKVEREPRDIPHQKHRTNFTVLTTTRSWKLDVIRLKPSEYDRHLDLHELDDIRLKKLVTKGVKVLNRTFGKHKTADDFIRHMAILNLGEILYTPFVILQCLCLWFNNEEIGRLKCQIYANIIESTLGRQTGKFQRKFLKKAEDRGVPACFKHKKNCKQHMVLLMVLGKMVCDSLINTENRQMLVMDLDFVGQYLKEEELTYCLKLGLLSQNKDCGKVSARVSNVSFPHKSVHEFFVALYVHSVGTATSSSSLERETVLNAVFNACSDLSKILEISAVLKFLSGLDSLLCSQILKTFSTVVTRDSICKTYRAGVDFEYNYDEYKTMFNFQTLLTDCACEMRLNGEEVQSLPLEDIIINTRSKKAEYMSLLQSILQTSDINIKTLDIQQCADTTEVTQIFDMLELRSLSSLETFVSMAVTTEQDVQQLLQQSTDTLRTLCLCFVNYEENTGSYKTSWTELSEQCTDIILSMQLLQAIWLQSLFLSHYQLERIVAFITSRTTMTQVWLEDITCQDHKESCPGVMIDLSGLENLEMLTLSSVPVSQLQVNMRRLEECLIGGLPSRVISSCFRNLSAAQNLHIFRCINRSDDDTCIMIKTIPALIYLTELHVYDTNLGERKLSLSRNMTKLEYIALWKVTMTSESLWDLVNKVSHLVQSVDVWLTDCTVLPEDKYQAVTHKITQSNKYSVIRDGPDEYGRIVFNFRTVTETEDE